MSRSAIGALVFLLSISMVGSTWAEESKGINWRDGLEVAWKSMKEEQRPLLLFLTTNGCLYCTKMKARTYTDAKVINTVNATFVAAKVNAVDQPKLAKQLGVRVYPTTVIISPEARVLESIGGYVTPDQFNRRIEAAARRFETAQRKPATVK